MAIPVVLPPTRPGTDARIEGPTFLEFFAGAGLVRLALEPEWRCLWANDLDARKAEIYRRNFGADALVLGDVAGIAASSLPRADVAWASFPCQDLSLAGLRAGIFAPRSGAFWGCWRLLRDLRDRGSCPPVIVLENVPGLLYDGNFTYVARALAALEMQFGALILNARPFVPQSRARVFVVAVEVRRDCTPFLASSPDAGPWFPGPLRRAQAALPRSLATLWRWWKLPEPQIPVPSLETLLEDHPSDGCWHSARETLRLLRLMRPKARQQVRAAHTGRKPLKGLLTLRGRGGILYAEARLDGYAPCLVASRRGRQTTVLVADRSGVRSRWLLPREAARLMGVPDTFELPDRKSTAFDALGDGVVVPVVRHLARHLLTPLTQARQEVDLEERLQTHRERIVAAQRRVAENSLRRWERQRSRQCGRPSGTASRERGSRSSHASLGSIRQPRADQRRMIPVTLLSEKQSA